MTPLISMVDCGCLGLEKILLSDLCFVKVVLMFIFRHILEIVSLRNFHIRNKKFLFTIYPTSLAPLSLLHVPSSNLTGVSVGLECAFQVLFSS